MEKSMYEQLGVDSSKKSVCDTFEKVVDNEYPNAFVNVISDPLNPKRVLTQHQDGDGSKFIQRLLHYYETGDENIFLGMVDDALSMNTGDIAAAGFVFGPIIVSDVLNLGVTADLKKIIMDKVAQRFSELKALYRLYDLDLRFLGGETADLPDQVSSGTFDVAVTAWTKKRFLISGDTKPGEVIIGLMSDGQAAWEEEINSGLMSNGLTMARTVLMSRMFNEKYPQLRGRNSYRGQFFPGSKAHALPEMTVGQALTSPTRQWAIVIHEILSELKKRKALPLISGITMNTGGGATKISRIGKGVCYSKAMPVPPSIFQLIKEESGESWFNMYKSFNCGVGIDIVGANSPILFDAIKAATDRCEIEWCHLGEVEAGSNSEKNEIKLQTPFGNFNY